VRSAREKSANTKASTLIAKKLVGPLAVMQCKLAGAWTSGRDSLGRSHEQIAGSVGMRPKPEEFPHDRAI